MSPAADVDLCAPFKEDIILEVRSSKMKTMPGLTIQSGIDKTIREGVVTVTHLGIEGDEHDPTFHGGRDKAIHGCDPEAGLLLQVSLPRQPCFKLNHRFRLKNFAPRTYGLSRTGWYYRVLRPGPLEAGMPIALVERKHAKWTIERLQEFLHRTQDDTEMNEELSNIEEMGDEARGAFVKRVAKAKAAAARKERAATEPAEEWRDYKIVEKKRQTDRISSFILEAQAPAPDDADAGPSLLGAHARIKLPSGLVRSYSVVSGTVRRFELGVALEEQSRGGSAWLHNTAGEGTTLAVSSRLGSEGGVTVSSASSSHAFVAGGIGITAFLSLLGALKRIHLDAVLHYAVRSESDVPFREALDELGQPAPNKDGRVEESSVKVVLYRKDRGERMDVGHIFRNLGWNGHAYVCGPRRLMDAALAASKEAGLTEDDVHFEAFGADTTGDPFEVEVLNRDGKLLHVDAEETLLEVLRREFGTAQIASSCEVGNCVVE
ncbi:hypothetical protein KJ359_012981 [Pestalotiopsis sp. 9143b]|nr:hypothetical protein KJ359_012981 [Pestalotiopsis sp. 9143b]